MLDVFLKFDVWIMSSINSLVGKSTAFDQIVLSFANFSLVKGGLFMMVIWSLWFWKKEGEEQSTTRQKILLVTIGAVGALIVGRLSQALMPHRVRPIHDSSVEFEAPFGGKAEALDGWTSLPSDHAIIFFALAVGVMAIHRKVGIFLFLWSIIVIGFPRIYVGVHFPTDIIAGAIIGIVLMFIVLMIPVPNRLLNFAMSIEKNYGWLFYPFAFLITWQLALLGPNLKRTIATVLKLLKALF